VNLSASLRLVAALAFAAAGVAMSAAIAADAPPPPPAGKVFATPEEAAQALVAAAEKNDDAALVEILGPGSEDVVQAGVDVIVASERRRFATAAQTRIAFDRAYEAQGLLVLEVGPAARPVSIPLRSTDQGWAFDTAAGRAGLLARRIEQNEYETIALCRAFLSAQVDYASKDRDGDRLREFAQKLRSTPGKRDGLYWPADLKSGEEESPLADALAPLRDAAASSATPVPFNGYYFRILTAQGRHAPGGAHSYLLDGNLIAGCALLAVPARHASTGVKSYLVSHHGRIYEKDLGPDGIRTAYALPGFDPDPSWTRLTHEQEAKAIKFWEE
jgi:hypothetical protein